ncbi:MAG: PKD domain-containing protein, partial [Candidatus Dormibacteria bacterium]
PTAVSVTGQTNQATLTWTPPASSVVAPITSYSIVPSFNGRPQTATSVSVGAGTVTANANGSYSTTLSELQSGASYSYTIAAVNAMGTGAPSAPVSLVPTAAPGPPPGVSAVAGNGHATVSWQPADSEGSPITGYTVTATQTGAQGAGTANMLNSADASFESGLGTWTSGSSTTSISQSSAAAEVGSYSMAMTAQSAGNLSATTGCYPVVPGQQYTAVISAMAATTGRSVYVQINWDDINRDYFSNSGTGFTDTTGAWTQGAVTLTAPAGAAYANIQFNVWSAASGEVHYADAAMLTLGSGTTWAAGSGAGVVATVAAGAGATSAVVNGLVDGMIYTFSVAASNADGLGMAAEPLQALTASGASPVALYPLSDPACCTAADSSGHGNTGTYTSSGIAYRVAGPVNGSSAVELNGSTGEVTLPTAVQVQAPLTLEAWVDPTSCASSDGSYNWVVTTGDPGARMLITPTCQLIGTMNLGGTTYWGWSPPNIVPLNQWSRLDVAFNEVTGTINDYVDGVLAWSGSMATTGTIPYQAGNPGSIGADFYGGWHEFFAGEIADVGVYPSALTQSQLDAQFTPGNAPQVAVSLGGSPYARGQTATVTATVSPQGGLGAGRATPTFVQGTSAYSGTSTVTSLKASFTNSVAAGDLLVLGATVRDASKSPGTISAVSDSLNGSWTKVTTEAGGTSGTEVELWERAGSLAGAVTVTVTLSKADTVELVLGEYSGLLAASPLDQSAVGTSGTSKGSSPMSTAATAALSLSGELVIGVGDSYSGDISAAGTGFTLRETGTSKYLGLEDMVASSASGQSMSMAMSASDYDAAIVATFKPAVTANSPPVAALTMTPASGAAPLAVTASASGSLAGGHPISGYTFNFGDGTTVGPQATATATHSYAKGGVYAVTVTATDTAGASSTAAVMEYVGQPSAALTMVPSMGPASLTVTADAAASSDPIGISSYTFAFGDGTTVGPQAGATASHTYATAGTYTVTLTTADSSGATATATSTVTVSAAVTSIPSVPTFVQGAEAIGKTVALPSGVTAGDLLVVGITTNDTSSTDPITAVSDSLNGAWTEVASAHYGNGHVDLWYVLNSKAGSDTVTITGVAAALTAAEYKAVATSSALNEDATNTGDNSATLTAGPTSAISASGELVLGVGGEISVGSGFTVGSGFALREQAISAGTCNTGLEDMLSTSTSGQSMTMGGSSTGYYGAVVAVFKAAAATTPPTAALSLSPTSGAEPLAVTASASASKAGTHAISTYTFNFGDGTTVGPQAAATATHTYAKGGVYAATVTVTDSTGVTATATAEELVGQPAAALTVVPSTGTAPLAVVANGGASADPIGLSSYTFNFGDGTTVGPQAGATAAHTYASAGTYTVTLTVKDGGGASATATSTETVAAAGGPETADLVIPLAGTGFDSAGGTVSIGGTSCASISGVTCTVSPSQITVSGLSVPVAGVAVVATVRALGSDSVCTQPTMTATVTDASTGLGGLGSAPAVICDGGLGVQQWWTFVSTALGPGGTAEVNAANGNLVVSQQDGGTMQLHGNLSLGIVRAYDSEATVQPGAEPVGSGWITSFVSAGDELGGVALRIPSAEHVNGGAAITLITDSGARDVFEPAVLGTPVDESTLSNPTGPLGPLVPTTLTLGTGYTALCVDDAYTPEAGVHASMWRYVESNTGGCTGLTSSTAAVLGYATLTTDGVREEYNASGELLSVRDALGNRVDFTYSGTELTRVGETGGSNRAYSLVYTTWSGGVEVNITDPAGEVTEYQDNSAGELVNVLNPSGSSLHYTYGGCGGSATQLCSAENPDGNSVTFVYQASPFGGPSEISEVINLLGTETAYTYAANGAVQNAITGSEEEHFAQVDALGRVGEVDEGSTSTSSANPGGPLGVWLHTTLYQWDAPGFGCQQPDAVPDNNLCDILELSLNNGQTPNRETQYTYNDEGGILIQDDLDSPTNVVTTTSYTAQYVESSGAVRTFTDSIAGGGAVTSQAGPRRDASTLIVLSDQTGVLSPNGNAAGSSYPAFETTSTRDINTAVGAGLPLGATTPCTGTGASATANTGLLCATTAPSKDGGGQPDTVTTYAYDHWGQRTCMSTPNPNAGKPQTCGAVASYTYTYYPDSATDLSGTTHAGGWLEATSDPTGAFVLYGYDMEGHLIRTWDRDATAQAGLTLPLAAYPTCTSPAASTGYTQTLYASSCTAQPGLYAVSQTDALGDVTTYQLDADGNQLGVRTPRGNQSSSGTPTCRTNPGTSGPWGGGTYDTCYSYNAAGEVLTEQQPVEAGEPNSPHSTDVYDAYGNLIQNTDAASDITTYTYDAVNRKATATVGRYAASSTLYAAAGSDAVPDGCTTTTSSTPTQATVGGGAWWPSAGEVVCTTTTTYDGEDNPTSVQSPASEVSDLVGSLEPTVTTSVYDAYHRVIETITPRWDGTTRTLTTAKVYDPDGNVVESCPATEFTEGQGSCGGTSPGTNIGYSTVGDSPSLTTDDSFSTYTAYDPADLPVSVTTDALVAGTLTPAVTATTYDADGNVLTTTNAKGVTVTNDYNVLDRLLWTATPENPGEYATSWYGYDPSGNRVWTAQPSTFSATVPTSTSTAPTTATGTRDTIVSYDADNRSVDTVVAAVDTSGMPNVCFSNFSSFGMSTSGCSQEQLGVTDASGGVNIHTRVVYDADGNQVAAYSADAFQSSLTSPSTDYMMATTFDADDRPIAQYVPRYDDATSSTTSSFTASVPAVSSGSQAQTAECPLATTQIPAQGTSWGTGGVGQPPTSTTLPYLQYTGVCITAVQYNGDGQVTETLMPTAGGAWTVSGVASTQVETYVYTADGLRTQIVAPNPDGTGTVTQTSILDAAGNVVLSIQPNPDTTSGQPATVDTTSVYSADGLLLSTTAPPSQGLALTGGQNPASPTTNPSAGGETPGGPPDTTTFTYDAAGNQVSSTDSYGATTVTAYTVSGQKESVAAPSGGALGTNGQPDLQPYVTDYTYDVVGNLLTVTTPSGTARDATNPTGAPTTYTYTENNLLATTVTPPGSGGASLETDDTYNAFGQTLSQHTYQVGIANCPVNGPPSSSCDGGTISDTYYLDGRMASETPEGVTTQTLATNANAFTYDASGNETEAANVVGTASAGAIDTMTYYLDGSLRTEDDGSGDAQVSGRSGGLDMAGYQAELTYDGAGNIATLTMARDGGAQSTTEALAYNAADVPVTLGTTADPSGAAETRSYTADGQLASQTQSNGDVTSYSYNPDGAIQQDWLCGEGSSPSGSCNSASTDIIDWWAYSYDSDGQQVASEAALSSDDTIFNYAYDPDGRLAAYSYDDDDSLSGSTPQVYVWTPIAYDHDGNRTSSIATGTATASTLGVSTTSTYNANDSLSTTTTTTPATGTTPAATNTETDSYDTDGRLASDGCTDYSYDGFNQTAVAADLTGSSRNASCASLASGADTTTAYTYDALGRTITETEGTATNATATYWGDHYANLGNELALIQSGQATSSGAYGATENDLSLLLDASGTPSEVVGVQGTADSGGAQWFTSDGQGNVGAVTGSANSGAAVCVLKYDVSGSPLQATSATNPCIAGAGTGSQLTELGYQFSQRDATTGDYTFGSRTYDPSKGAFTTPDEYQPGSTGEDLSIGADPLTADTYGYANANPISLRDPEGHSAGATPGCNEACQQEMQVCAPNCGAGAPSSDNGGSSDSSGGKPAAAQTDAYGCPIGNQGCDSEMQLVQGDQADAEWAAIGSAATQYSAMVSTPAGCTGSCAQEWQVASVSIQQANPGLVAAAQMEQSEQQEQASLAAMFQSDQQRYELQQAQLAAQRTAAANACSGPFCWMGAVGSFVGSHWQQIALTAAMVGVQFVPGLDVAADAGLAIDAGETIADAGDVVDAVDAGSEATEAGTEVAEEGGDAAEDGANCLIAGGESFSAGSQVVLASGATVAISQLRPGAQVLATNPQTGRSQAETVQAVMVNHDTDLMDVVVNTAQGQGTIDSTDHHLFWDLTTRKWTEVDQLRTGDRLFTPNGQLATVARLVAVPGSEEMWDLTVANDHDFYVATVDTAVLVHNCPSSFEKMPQGDNTAANATARAAAQQAMRDTGQALTRQEIHDVVSGQGYSSYQELYEAYVEYLQSR